MILCLLHEPFFHRSFIELTVRWFSFPVWMMSAEMWRRKRHRKVHLSTLTFMSESYTYERRQNTCNRYTKFLIYRIRCIVWYFCITPLLRETSIQRKLRFNAAKNIQTTSFAFHRERLRDRCKMSEHTCCG